MPGHKRRVGESLVYRNGGGLADPGDTVGIVGLMQTVDVDRARLGQLVGFPYLYPLSTVGDQGGPRRRGGRQSLTLIAPHGGRLHRKIRDRLSELHRSESEDTGATIGGRLLRVGLLSIGTHQLTKVRGHTRCSRDRRRHHRPGPGVLIFRPELVLPSNSCCVAGRDGGPGSRVAAVPAPTMAGLIRKR